MWTEEDEILIEIIKRYEWLYNQQHACYKDVRKENSWREIGETARPRIEDSGKSCHLYHCSHFTFLYIAMHHHHSYLLTKSATCREAQHAFITLYISDSLLYIVYIILLTE